jgi:hypothetical protein
MSTAFVSPGCVSRLGVSSSQQFLRVCFAMPLTHDKGHYYAITGLTGRGRSGKVSKRKQPKENPVTGIQFLTDEKGRKTSVVIDLKKHKKLWEDLQDVLVSQSRRHEKGIPFDKVKADLIKSGKLHG